MKVIDLHDPLSKWAKKNLMITDEELQSGEKRLDIDTTRLRITAGAPDFTEKVVTGNGSPSGVVFKSRYVNNTTAPQEHTFIMERATEATVTTSLKKGFTRNGTVGIRLDVPESITKLTGGFGSDVIVETEDENIVKHSVSWSINSRVNAPPKRTTIAELRINESRSEFSFKACVTLRGRVLAKVIDVSTGRALLHIEGDLATVLHDEKEGCAFSPGRDVDIDIATRKVKWEVEGSLKFRFGVSQDVQVDYE